jgi:AraC family transcriptional regulator, arabinose operon regulatory protein
MLQMGSSQLVLQPPIPVYRWGRERIYAVAWYIDQQRHYVSGSCVDKVKTVLDLGTEGYVRNHLGCNLLLAGRGTYRDWEGHDHPLRSGTLFQRLPLRANTVWIDPDQPWRECYISVASATWRYLRSLGVGLELPVIPLAEPSAVVRQFRRLFQVLDGSTSYEAPRVLLAVQELFLAISEQHQRLSKRRRHDAAIEQACRLLERDLRQSCDARDVAQTVGLPYESFRKAFRQAMGCSPTAFHQRRRIDRACVLLGTSQMQIAEVASRLGYSDAFAFSARFRRVMGCSPSAYRQRQ